MSLRREGCLSGTLKMEQPVLLSPGRQGTQVWRTRDPGGGARHSCLGTRDPGVCVRGKGIQACGVGDPGVRGKRSSVEGEGSKCGVQGIQVLVTRNPCMKGKRIQAWLLGDPDARFKGSLCKGQRIQVWGSRDPREGTRDPAGEPGMGEQAVLG